MKPLVAVTTWIRTVDTFIGPDTAIHTLVDYYAEALDRAGTAMVLVAHLDPPDADQILDRVDGLVVTGGGDIDPSVYGQRNTLSERIEPSHDLRDLALIEGARSRNMPVLGICRGLQAVNVAFGGSLGQHVLSDDDVDHPTLSTDALERNEHRHVVELGSESRLAAIYGTTERKVNSLHHQAVAETGRDIVVTGRTGDGSIEAVESADPAWPMLAVQWHPEMDGDGPENALFAAFVKDAAAYASR